MPNSAQMPSDEPLQLQLRAKTTPALLLSMVFHIVALVVIGLMLGQVERGTGEQADRPVGIAMVHRMPDRDRYVEASQVQPTPTESTQSATSAAASAAAAPPADLAPPLDLDGILEAIKASPSPVSGTGMAGETQLDGDAFGDADGAGKSSSDDDATTMVFGVSGSGSQFVYVFDRSDSMNGYGGRPLRAAKSELIKSLSGLTDRQRFQLIFYNDKPSPMRLSRSPLQMFAADAPSVTAAKQHINSITAYGGTEHSSALKMALQLGPDVIFFLTDARIPRISPSDLRDIQIRAQRTGTTIHAIEFGTDAMAPSESFLKELAAMNQGKYQYVNVQEL
ncbi:vWA domain-containing protein [Rubripirellula amarantea]|nr:VWA domain-containing protein [Rubripirellula amarantea]